MLDAPIKDVGKDLKLACDVFSVCFQTVQYRQLTMRVGPKL